MRNPNYLPTSSIYNSDSEDDRDYYEENPEIGTPRDYQDEFYDPVFRKRQEEVLRKAQENLDIFYDRPIRLFSENSDSSSNVYDSDSYHSSENLDESDQENSSVKQGLRVQSSNGNIIINSEISLDFPNSVPPAINIVTTPTNLAHVSDITEEKIAAPKTSFISRFFCCLKPSAKIYATSEK